MAVHESPPSELGCCPSSTGHCDSTSGTYGDASAWTDAPSYKLGCSNKHAFSWADSAPNQYATTRSNRHADLTRTYSDTEGESHANSEGHLQAEPKDVLTHASSIQSTSSGGRTLLECAEPMMGTRIGLHVACLPDREDAARTAMSACLNWLQDLERRLTRFNSESELSRLNASSGSWQPVSELLYAALEESLAAARATDGLFDPALLPVLESIGYDRDINLLPQESGLAGLVPLTSSSIPASLTGGTWHGISLDASEKRVKLPLGTQLDLGGIAKGWAADLALERFFRGFEGALIDIGADMRVFGHDELGQPWPLGIHDPRSGGETPARHLGVFSLSSGGVACSGALDRWWWRGGERRHHLIDPRTGEPMRLWLDKANDSLGADTLIATVTALSPTGAHAEVAAKVALLRGYPEALRAVESAWDDACLSTVAPYGDAGTALILVMGDGTMYCSKNLREWLVTCGGGGELWLE